MTLVIHLPYWQADREDAARLARFITQIEPARRDDVKIRFMARWDCPHLDMADMQFAGTRFDVSWAKTTTQWDGWPSGPNGMAKDILAGCEQAFHDIGWNDVDGILLMEPDCVPLCRHWLDKLIAEWKLARENGAWIMGSWRNSGTDIGHINGNAIYVPDLKDHVSLKHIVPGLAWDCALVNQRVASHWHRTGLIRNDFQSRGATEKVLRTPEIGTQHPVLIHGYKDHSSYEIARKWIFNQ